MERENNNMENTRYEALTAAYLSGNITAVEKAELMQWVEASEPNRKFFDNWVKLWEMSGAYEAQTFPLQKEAAWARLEARLFASPEVQPRRDNLRLLLYWRWAAVAATLALLIAAAWWQWQLGTTETTVAWTTVSTREAERTQLTLPDGSQVWLNENAQLRYAFSEDERTLELTGEAYFEVATDSLRPFRVSAGEVVASVLGTAFNLRAYPHEAAIELSVTQGKVALAQQGRPTEKAVFAAGQAGAYAKADAKIERKSEAETTNALAWKERRLTFDETPLAEVSEALARYYDLDVKLSAPAMGKCKFTGSFDNLAVDDVLQILAFTMDLEIKRDSAVVEFSGGKFCE